MNHKPIGAVAALLILGAISGAEAQSTPTITTQPASIVVAAGERTTLSVAASSSASLSYQWYKYGTPVTGATSASLVFQSTRMADAGFYYVRVSSGGSSVDSDSVEIRVEPRFYPNLLRPSTTFNPRFESTGASLDVVLPLDDGRFYVGGNFSSVDGQSRMKLVRFLPNGSVDLTFDPPRIVGWRVSALAPQPDGKLLVAGSLTVADDPARRDLIRLNENGTLDPTFTFPGGMGDSAAIETIAIQENGQILIGGSFTTIGGELRGRIARLNTDGTLDPQFVTGSGFNVVVQAIVVQSDGRIVVQGGFAWYGNVPTPSYGLARLTSTGSLDDTFTISPGQTAVPTALLRLPNDELLVGLGYGPADSPMLVHLAANGTVKTTFALQSPGGTVAIDHLARQSDGRVVANIMRLEGGGILTGEVVRFRTDGVLDNTFVGGETGARQRVTTLAANANDSILVGGMNTFADAEVDGLARLDADGELDLGFQPEFLREGAVRKILPAAGGGWWVGGLFGRVNGTPTAPLVKLTETGEVAPGFSADTKLYAVYDFAVQGDGRIVVAGYYDRQDNDIPAWGLVRLQTNGQRDVSFQPVPFASSNSTEVELLPDGSVVASAISHSGFNMGVLARIAPNGTVDPAYTHSFLYAREPQVIEALPDGRVLAGEWTDSSVHMLVRLNPDGTIDPEFDASFSNPPQQLARGFDGKLWVAGIFDNGHFPVQYRNLIRLEEVGARDEHFLLEEPLSTLIQVLIPEKNGNVLIIGVDDTFAGANPRTNLARFHPDGTRAPGPIIEGFDENAVVTTAAYTENGGLLLATHHDFGSVVSRGLVLLEPAGVPRILEQPKTPQPVSAGGKGITLSIDALANADAKYRWQFAPDEQSDFVDLPGSNGPTLVLPVPQRYQHGLYRVIISSGSEAVTSESVAVTINEPVTSPAARLVNLSTRGLAQAGDNVLIPGFVVSGAQPKRLLIRAVGPTLRLKPFNIVPPTAPDPRLILKRLDTSQKPPVYIDVATSDDWVDQENADDILTTGAELYAFPLKDEREAALLTDLAPGQYTVVAGDKNNERGIAVVELYDADPDDLENGSRLINISNRGFCGVGHEVMIPGFWVSHEGPKTFLIRVVGPRLTEDPFNVTGTMADPKLTIYSGPNAILENDNWGDNPDAADTAAIAQQVYAFALKDGSKDAALVVTLPPGGYTVVGSSAVEGETGIVLVEVYVVE